MLLELKSFRQRRGSLDSIVSIVELKTALIKFHLSRLQTALERKEMMVSVVLCNSSHLAALVLSKGSSMRR